MNVNVILRRVYHENGKLSVARLEGVFLTRELAEEHILRLKKADGNNCNIDYSIYLEEVIVKENQYDYGDNY